MVSIHKKPHPERPYETKIPLIGQKQMEQIKSVLELLRNQPPKGRRTKGPM